MSERKVERAVDVLREAEGTLSENTDRIRELTEDMKRLNDRIHSPDPVPSLSAPAWTIYPCPVHGLAHGPDQTVMPLHNYCWRCDQMREGPSSYPANPVRVVPRERAEKAERELAECKEALERLVDCRDGPTQVAVMEWEKAWDAAREVLDRGVS